MALSDIIALAALAFSFLQSLLPATAGFRMRIFVIFLVTAGLIFAAPRLIKKNEASNTNSVPRQHQWHRFEVVI